jgi:NAD(P)H-hydrate epimerase
LKIPAVTAEQMREVDRAMVEDLHIELVQMMENAGRNLAQLAIAEFAPATATLLAGPGGNGGGGLVAARHLANRDVSVQVVLAQPAEAMAAVPAHQLDILERRGVPIAKEPAPADLVIDALLGYSLHGDPRGRPAQLIEWANAQAWPVLALDTPSGLDVTTGRPASPCVRATATLTLALPKTGLLHAVEQVGRLHVADISVPPLVYRSMGIEVPAIFRHDSIVAVDGAIE